MCDAEAGLGWLHCNSLPQKAISHCFPAAWLCCASLLLPSIQTCIGFCPTPLYFPHKYRITQVRHHRASLRTGCAGAGSSARCVQPCLHLCLFLLGCYSVGKHQNGFISPIPYSTAAFRRVGISGASESSACSLPASAHGRK